MDRTKRIARIRLLRSLRRTSPAIAMMVQWRKVSRARKAVLFGLLALNLIIFGICSFSYHEALAQASLVPTVERPTVIDDHGNKFYVTHGQKSFLSMMGAANFVLVLVTLGFAFYLVRFLAFARKSAVRFQLVTEPRKPNES